MAGEANDGGAANVGTVFSVRGSVVDVRFEARLPPINSLLRAGEDGRVLIEVLAQIDEHRVRKFVGSIARVVIG